MSITARRRWSMRCCTRAACSAPTSGSPSARSTTSTWSASGASRFSPRTPPSAIATCSSTSSTRRATPTSGARSSGPSRWSTASSCWSTPPRGPCRRRGSCCARRSNRGCRPSSSSTRWTAATRVRPRCSTKSTISLSTSTLPRNRSSFRCSTRTPRRARRASTPPPRGGTCARCSTPSPSGFRRRGAMPRRRCRSWWRTSTPATTWAASRSAASSTAGWRRATRSRSRSSTGGWTARG